MDIRTIWTIPIVLIFATGIPTALAAHSPAYLYGFGLGKMQDCEDTTMS